RPCTGDPIAGFGEALQGALQQAAQYQPGGSAGRPAGQTTDDRQRAADTGLDNDGLIIGFRCQLGAPVNTDLGCRRVEAQPIGMGNTAVELETTADAIELQTLTENIAKIEHQ